jgi:hypothetical protein
MPLLPKDYIPLEVFPVADLIFPSSFALALSLTYS